MRWTLLTVPVLAVALIIAHGVSTPAAAETEQVVEIVTRGQHMRALRIEPKKPIGSVILLAGGHGNLAISKDGRIGWGAGNQLVRTRADYAKAGFATLVPDIAPDLKQGSGGVPKYRWSVAYATDIGASVKYMRGIAQPVYLVGTSRAALSVAKAGVQLVSGPERPDALVITSGMLFHTVDTQPSVQRNVGGLAHIGQPVLVVYHEKDGCPYTPASSAPRAKALFTGAKKVDIVIVRGASAGSGEPCEANSPHGFARQDGEVVKIVTDWLKKL
jgi:pimeloyl-ACP methyl ester carboxylesterase